MGIPATETQGATEVREGRRGTLPDLNPWREVGWIFRDGETIAIERQDDHLRVRSVSEEAADQSS
jgi:hypothetical protein